MAGLNTAIGPGGIKTYALAGAVAAGTTPDAAAIAAIAVAANELDDLTDLPSIGGDPNVLAYLVFGAAAGRSVAGPDVATQMQLSGEAKSTGEAKSIGTLVAAARNAEYQMVWSLEQGALATYVFLPVKKISHKLVPSASDPAKWEVTVATSGEMVIEDKP